MRYKYFFTITAGRTGTAWLSDFLAQNLNIEAVHEPLEIDDFGTRMPDIKLMRTFNERGNTEVVKKFFRSKLNEVAARPSYAETNHTLAKCGLIENLADHPICNETCVVVLRRNFVKQCVSHVTREDFRNITVSWQWYLSIEYKNLIVNPRPFLQFGQIGRALWYVYEMDARQKYYEVQYSDKVNLVSANLDELTTRRGAEKFMRDIDAGGNPYLPEPSNATRATPAPEIKTKASELIKRIKYNPESMVANYISAGRRLDGQ